MTTLNSTVAALALLAGTTLTPISVYAQDQGTGMDQSGGVDQGSNAGDDELLLKNQQQNEATSGEDTSMPDAQQQDQAETNEVQDPGGESGERSRDVGDAGNLVQVFVLGGEPAGDAALPAVDQSKRQHPHQRGHVGRGEHRPPRPSRREVGPVPPHQHRHAYRRRRSRS